MSLTNRADMPIPVQGETWCNDPDLLLLSRPEVRSAHQWDVAPDDRYAMSYRDCERFDPYWPEVEW